MFNSSCKTNWTESLRLKRKHYIHIFVQCKNNLQSDYFILKLNVLFLPFGKKKSHAYFFYWLYFGLGREYFLYNNIKKILKMFLGFPKKLLLSKSNKGKQMHLKFINFLLLTIFRDILITYTLKLLILNFFFLYNVTLTKSH